MAGWWRDAQADAAKVRSSKLDESRASWRSRVAVGGATLLASALSAAPVHAQPFDCTSSDPSKWPAAAKPYFLVMVDTSGSMTSGVGSEDRARISLEDVRVRARQLASRLANGKMAWQSGSIPA